MPDQVFVFLFEIQYAPENRKIQANYIPILFPQGLFLLPSNVRVFVDLLVSGGWDKKLKAWDIRVPSPLVYEIDLPDKVYAMDLCDGKLVVAMAGRHIYVYDMTCLPTCMQKRDSSIKYQTRAVRCFSDAQGKIQVYIENNMCMYTACMRSVCMCILVVVFRVSMWLHRRSGLCGLL